MSNHYNVLQSELCSFDFYKIYLTIYFNPFHGKDGIESAFTQVHGSKTYT